MSRAATFRTWSCTVRLVVEDDRALAPATAQLAGLLDRVDRAASRFRIDSALSIANSRAGRPSPVPRLLVDLVGAALRAAERTDGAVVPTVGAAMNAIGYDSDICEVGDTGEPLQPRPAGDWRAVRLDREVGLLTVPRGCALDLGATAKAYTADLAARTLYRRFGTAVHVEIGGDLAVAGDRPDGWCVKVAEAEEADGQLVLARRGGLATSTTTIRRWTRAGRPVHHIVDPRTGLPADGPWRTASVAAPSALEANIASTAAIVLGDRAVGWLQKHRFAARLVAQDGSVHLTSGWPAARTLVGAR
jgi:thiamine biosynthesis lipoprotein